MEEERKFCVYKHTSPSGKVYIGITGQNPKNRWHNGEGYKDNPYFYKAIQKYGWSNFEHEILFDKLLKIQAEEKEIEMIAYYKSNERDFGYNIRPGGCCSLLSDETKKKISKAHIGKKKGPLSEEVKQKISSANKGKTLSEDAKIKISESCRKRWENEDYRNNIICKLKTYTGKNSTFYGKHHSQATKEKLSVLNCGANNPWAKMVLQCDSQNSPIRIWDCIKQACDEIGANKDSISGCCRGIRKSAGGYKWLYVYDQTKRDGTLIKGALSLGYITEEEIENAKNSSI